MISTDRSGAVFILCLLAIVAWSESAIATPPADYGLVWADEFDGSAIDTAKWTVRTGLGRDDIYTTQAVTVGGGVMTINTYTDNGTHYNGWIDTKQTYLPTKGYFEARINFNTTPGMWSAFWLQSPGMHPYSGVKNPATNGVEIDIMEHRANSHFVDDLHSAIHWGGYGSEHESISRTTGNSSLGNGSWHTYGLLWTDTQYVFYFDGNPVWTVSRSDLISHVPEYLILSSEVQDNSWAGNIPSGGYGNLATTTTNMQVDYVRVYQVIPEPASFASAVLMLLSMGARRSRRILPSAH